MLRLLCNGVNLDIKSDQSITMTRYNPMFGFDKLQCERTTEFSLPDTPTNNRVFAMAKMPSTQGNAMRVRYNAQLVDGMCAQSGYLYVSEYDGEYKAVFITGDLLGLKRIKDAGNIRELVANTSVQVAESGKKPNTATGTTFDTVAYQSDGSVCYPSYCINALISEAKTKLGVSIQPIDTILFGHPAKTKTLQLTNTMLISARSSSEQAALNSISCPLGVFSYENGSITYYHTEAESVGGGYYTEKIIADGSIDIVFFRAIFDMYLTFPEDTPSEYFIKYRTVGYDRNLAGRTITIKKDTQFIILADGDYVNEQTGGPYYEQDGVPFYTYTERYPLSGSNLTYNLPISVEAVNKTAQVGELVYLHDNLPDITLIDLLKSVSYIIGKVLNYTDKDGVTFDNLATYNWPTIDLTEKLISISNIKRTFGDYASSNIIRFDSWDSTPTADKLTADYSINNVNIKRSKDLAVLKFSEGVRDENNTRHVYIKETEPGKTDTIAIAGETDYLERVALRKNANLQRICDVSTSVKVKVMMSRFEYEQIKAKTVIMVQSVKYVWTESQYSDGVATFSLSKI